MIIGTAEYSDKVQPIAEQLGVPLMVLTTDDYTGEAEDASEWLLGKNSVTFGIKTFLTIGTYNSYLNGSISLYMYMYTF